MNAETLEALKASIEKWKRNVKARTLEAYRTGPSDCALCLLFHPSWQEDRKAAWANACDGCPVKERTGSELCDGTPYEAAARAWEAWDAGDPSFDDMKALKKAAREAARAEVSFLESLLPVPAKSEV